MKNDMHYIQCGVRGALQVSSAALKLARSNCWVVNASFLVEQARAKSCVRGTSQRLKKIKLLHFFILYLAILREINLFLRLWKCLGKMQDCSTSVALAERKDKVVARLGLTSQEFIREVFRQVPERYVARFEDAFLVIPLYLESA